MIRRNITTQKQKEADFIASQTNNVLFSKAKKDIKKVLTLKQEPKSSALKAKDKCLAQSVNFQTKVLLFICEKNNFYVGKKEALARNKLFNTRTASEIFQGFLKSVPPQLRSPGVKNVIKFSDLNGLFLQLMRLGETNVF